MRAPMAVASATLWGAVKDRVFHAIALAGLLLLAVPALSTFSMRQVPVLGTALCYSLTSSVLLVIAVFLGATCLWRDIDRRTIFPLLGLPLSRSAYLLGRFAGMALLLLLSSTVLSLVSLGVIASLAGRYPPTPPLNLWVTFAAFVGLALKYILLMACGFLLSAFSTSFFLPVFGTLAIYLAGNTLMEVHRFLQTPEANKVVAPLVRMVAEGLYYVLPNFGAFDLSTAAAYGLPVTAGQLLWPVGYALLYGGILLVLAHICLCRREFK